MSTLKSIILIFLVSGFTLLTAEEFKKEYHEKFDVREGMQLRLLSGDGDVTITPWDKDEIQVDIVYHAEHRGGSSDDRAFQVEFDLTAKALHILAEERTGTRFGITSRHIYQYTYDIKSPAYMVLDIEGDDGNVMITGWKNDIECTIDDGDLELKDITCTEAYLRLEDGDLNISGMSADLSVWADDGDIEISDLQARKCALEVQDGLVKMDNVKGDFRIRFDDGDIDMLDVTGNVLDIRGQDGHIELGLVSSDNPDIHLETDDGPIRFSLDKDVSAELSVETDDGGISTRLSGETKVKEGRNWYHSVLHDGNGSITIRTRDGSVRVREM